MPPPGSPLAAPPGYVGYSASPMGSVPLKRIGGLAKAAMILVGAAAVTGIGTLLAGQAIVGDAENYLAGDLSKSDFQTSIVPYSLMGLAQAAAQIGAAVLVIVWMYRIASNHRTLQRVGRWQPGWAIGGWFLPPILNLIPFLMFRELWKASDPDVALGADWRSGKVHWVVTAWFVAFGPLQVVSVIASTSSGIGFGNSESALAEQIVDGQGAVVFGTVVSVVAAILFVVMARQLTDRHRRLIGEP